MWFSTASPAPATRNLCRESWEFGAFTRKARLAKSSSACKHGCVFLCGWAFEGSFKGKPMEATHLGVTS